MKPTMTPMQADTLMSVPAHELARQITAEVMQHLLGDSEQWIKDRQLGNAVTMPKQVTAWLAPDSQLLILEGTAIWDMNTFQYIKLATFRLIPDKVYSLQQIDTFTTQEAFNALRQQATALPKYAFQFTFAIDTELEEGQNVNS